MVAVTFLWVIVEGVGASLRSHYRYEQIVGMRYAVHLAVLAAVLLPRVGLRELVRTRRLGGQIARGLCMFVMPMSFIVVLDTHRSADLWVTFWICPLVVMVMAARWLGERVPLRTWILGCVGYLAVLLLAGRLPLMSSAAALPLLGSLSFALYVVLSRQLRDEPIGVSLFYTAATVLICILPLMLPLWTPVRLEDLWSIVAVGGLGLVFLWILDRSLERAPAAVVASYLYGVTVWEAGIGVLVTREWSRLTLVGGLVMALVLCGTLVYGFEYERQ